MIVFGGGGLDNKNTFGGGSGRVLEILYFHLLIFVMFLQVNISFLSQY